MNFEKLLCEVLEKVRKNIRKLDTDKLQEEHNFGEAVTEAFLSNLANFEGIKARFMAYEMIENVAKKVGNENLRKIAEKELDSIVTYSFAFQTMIVQMNIPPYKFSMLVRRAAFDIQGKVPKMIICSEEELDALHENLKIECGMDFEKYKNVLNAINTIRKYDKSDDDSTQNDIVDKSAEIAEEELDAFPTNSFATKLMIECEPKYEKRFREIIEKIRKKMIQDCRMLHAFKFVTDFMKCDPEYEKLLCEVLMKVREKITQDGGNENEAKSYFMVYEVIEKVAKKVGNENLRKIAEKELDLIVTYSFAFQTMIIQMNIPQSVRRAAFDIKGKFDKMIICSEGELDALRETLSMECGLDFEKYYYVCDEIYNMRTDDDFGDAIKNDRVDKLAEIAVEELDAFLTNSFTAKLMIECEPKYEKRFREIIEKVRKKMIKDDKMLQAFELVTNFLKCELEHEKLLCEVLMKVREKITQDGVNENVRKNEFEDNLGKFVAGEFLSKLRHAEDAKIDPAASKCLRDSIVCCKYTLMINLEEYELSQAICSLREQLKSTKDSVKIAHLSATINLAGKRCFELSYEKRKIERFFIDANQDGTSPEITEIRWEPPPLGWYKINSDGSYKDTDKLTYAGGLIRNSEGIWVRGFLKKLASGDTFVAELYGLMIGLQMAKGLQLRNVIAEIDSETAVWMVNGDIPCAIHVGIVTAIKKLISEARKKGEVEVRYVPREANSSADHLVKIAKVTPHVNLVIYRTPPIEIHYCLLRDAFGRAHLRQRNAGKTST